MASSGVVTASAASPRVAVERPWAVATLGHSRPAAAYLTLVNRGSETATLVDVCSPAAKVAEISRSTEDGKLVQIENVGRVKIDPGSAVTFSPEGTFIRLADYLSFFSEGDEIPLTLIFEDGRELYIEVPVFFPGTSHPYSRTTQ